MQIMRIRIWLLTLMRIQLLKMIRIHSDPDPQHCILKHIDNVMSIHRMLTCLGRPLRASPASLGPSFVALMSSSLPPSSPPLPWDFSLTSGSNTPGLYWPPSLSIQAQLGFLSAEKFSTTSGIKLQLGPQMDPAAVFKPSRLSTGVLLYACSSASDIFQVNFLSCSFTLLLVIFFKSTNDCWL